MKNDTKEEHVPSLREFLQTVQAGSGKTCAEENKGSEALDDLRSHGVHVMKKTIQRILVPLDPSTHCTAAVESACRVSRKHHATVTGLTTLDETEIREAVIPAYGPVINGIGKLYKDHLDHAEDVLTECRENFRRTCRTHGVPNDETEDKGVPSDRILEASMFYDLVVVGLRTFFHFEVHKKPGSTLDRILDRTITPILAVPEAGLDKVNRVLLAFDGSFPAGRMLHDFATFAQGYDPEILLYVADKDGEETQYLLEGVTTFLKAHGFNHVTPKATREPIEKVIDDDDLMDSIDLIALGIHSRKFVADLFVGSFAKALIKRGDKPLFLSH